MTEFLEFIKGNNYGVINSGTEYAMKLLEGSSIPDEEMEEMIGRIYTTNSKPFDSLKRIRDVGPLMTFLGNEDPQTIAVVASYMKGPQAAELIESLPSGKMTEVAMAIAKMDQTNRDVLIRIENHLNKKLENFITDDSSATDGVKTLVNILNNVTRHTERALFDHLEQKDEDLSKIIKDSMFVFEDIIKLDAMSLQIVINKITENELIAMALKTATEEMKERFYQAMTEGRKRLVDDATEGLRQVKRTDAEEAQQKVANIVKELEKNKEIVIQRGEDDVII
jgi:flagellar motor switch protein FliG